METDGNFNAPRGNGASPARRSTPASKALSDAAASADFPALQEALQNLPDSRPEAVEEAINLIADPNFPSKDKQQKLAQQLADQLASENDSLPS